jgi:hypothetical protein
MSNQYGPWATSIDAGGNPQLSTFWRRRLTMLVPASQSSLVLSRRSLVCLLAAGALMIGVPTFRVGTATADEEKPATVGSEPAPGSVPAKSSRSGEPKASEQPGNRTRGKVREKNAPAAQAAKRAYEATVAEYETGVADLESVYRWSCRWMQAERGERGDAAIQSHLDRMQASYDKIAKLHEVGAKGGSAANLAAARYYVVEAKEMLEQAKTSPGDATADAKAAKLLGKIPRRPRLYAPKIDAVAAGAEAIKQFDANNDGKLNGAELDRCPGLKTAIDQIDPSGNGEITAEMIAARIKAWQDSKVGRMSLGCVVLRNGKPLAGAEVKFVPEKFLGPNLKTAAGETDKNGVAMIALPDDPPPGLAPGFYRVEITKAGETIPAKYNTDTILGREVAIDAKGIQQGIKFNLKY